MLRHLMQNTLFSICAELEEGRCKGVEMRELNDELLHRSFREMSALEIKVMLLLQNSDNSCGNGMAFSNRLAPGKCIKMFLASS